ncbi:MULTISPECIES: class I SAM-dependent methyltransferase [unclassified Agrobacterium]|uniref:class I SAM-dependent methyltransferase n=1 Tax=unclassified Agrobacterium TaxID=2632611 RepID=UPI00244910DB|nr:MULTISPECIES: class I SAM-dependent methyltransferase [unclassified Agrobacterium]MDH0613110.1 class I SAM-dependent methyltransferase [Agrobacterium sp. GD03872]MDH0694975.1 class I SAM-dependent methyltransferase [Agrobacterium sp. GD03871]MDH1057627.1 class I SAM-dependent methyltransferase [Agrobacterium sp. GD03992]MDH2208916.1 class I SAM-dependent methyltransferase [Agrobacterium sp. GD03643]MDH2218407.1 class I SAM-dependent methyltransferase [Agrobacterium sp. GD03638]
MAPNQFSSGDVIADRRADYARMLAEGGDYPAAAELMEQALELAPRWTAGWFRFGEYHEKAGETAKAVVAYEKVAALDLEGLFAAELKLAVLGAAETPEQPPSRYVEGLFDDYADRFETSLVEKLDYSVPQKLAELIGKEAKDSAFDTVVDIGCGTGLLGVEIRSLAKRLEGFDISQNMLAKAEEKALYDHLGQADLSLDEESSGLFIPTLAQRRADLVAAADVMMYLGSLETVMPLVSALLKPSGLFAFSVEDAGDEEGFILRESLRYAHSKSYVTELLERTGFSLIEIRKTTIRKDAGKPLSGILFLARAKA